MTPSLLWLDNTERMEYPDMLSSDLNLDKLLTDKALGILRTSCTADEISARQAIFRKLRLDADFRAAVERLSASLAVFSQLTEACKAGVSEFEELILVRSRCASFLDVCDKLAQLADGTSPLLAGLQCYINSLADLRESLSGALAKSDSDVAGFNGASLTIEIDGKLTLSHDGTENLTAALADRITGFGLEPRLRTQPVLRIQRELSDALKKLLPDSYKRLLEFRAGYGSKPDEKLLKLRREIDFYTEIDSLTERSCKRRLPVCYPEFTAEKHYYAKNACDFTLLVKESEIVPNDIDFDGASAIAFLTGANGGGKTTYLRCAAANLLLALSGCAIFAESASLYKFDRICTHFPADESFTESSRLVEEAARVRSLLSICTPDSYLFMNETFSGTDDVKGAELTLGTAAEIAKLGAFALWVTHFHEVADKGYTMLTTVIDDTDSANRTFRIVKKRGDGSSYARDILRKYKLDAESLSKRKPTEVTNA